MPCDSLTESIINAGIHTLTLPCFFGSLTSTTLAAYKLVALIVFLKSCALPAANLSKYSLVGNYQSSPFFFMAIFNS
jgi:hypothetical protein